MTTSATTCKSNQGIPDRVSACVAIATQHRRLAAPLLSNYSVGAAVQIGETDIFGGANIEYGGGQGQADSKGIHAEEVAIANAIMQRGREAKITLVAIHAAGSRPTCCGDCLDIIRTYSGPNLLVAVSGDDGLSVFTLEQLFPENFPVVEPGQLPPRIHDLIEQARRFSSFGYTRYCRAIDRVSGVSLLADSHTIYGGVREDSVSYHPVSAVENALGASRIAQDIQLKAVAYVSETGRICGKDRQKLFERASQTGKPDLPIYILSLNNNSINFTTAAGLLPFGFTSDEF